MVKILITMIAAVVISLPSAAQQERKFIRGGNDLFNKQDFEKAEVEYRKALDTEVKSYEGAFNLGDALYKQKKFDEALQQFQSLAQNEKDKEKLGELYHNIGNTLLAMNKLDESIEAYKQSRSSSRSVRPRPATAPTPATVWATPTIRSGRSTVRSRPMPAPRLPVATPPRRATPATSGP